MMILCFLLYQEPPERRVFPEMKRRDNMKHINRVLALMLTLVLLFTGVNWDAFTGVNAYAATASAGSEAQGDTPEGLLSLGGWLYWVEDGQAIVAGYEDRSVSSLQIPARLGGYPVTGIGQKAFCENAALRTIEVPTNVTRIADDAFFGLSSVTLIAYHGAYALAYAAGKGLGGRSIAMPGVVFADGVLDLSGLPEGAYHGLNEGGAVFRAKEATFLEVGQILYFPKNSLYPTGLAVRVEMLTANGEELYAVFSQPEWGDCFENVSGEEELYLDWGNAIVYEGFESTDVAASAASFKHSFNISQKIGEDKLSGSITLNIGKPTASYDVGWRWWGILRIPDIKKVEVNIPITTDLKVTLAGKDGLEASHGQGRMMKRKSFHIADVPAISISGAINGYVAIDWVLEFAGSVEAAATIVSTVTLTYQNGSVRKNTQRDWRNVSLKVEAGFKTGPELSIYFVLGWGGFSIRFVEFTAGAYLKGTGSAKVTWLSKSTKPYMSCVDLTLAVEIELEGKIGLVKLAKHDCSFYESFSVTFGPWTIMSGHWDDLISVGKSDKCTLLNRKVRIVTDGNTREVTANVGSRLGAQSTPYKAGHTFDGWYVNTAASGLPGADYPFNFIQDTVPYCGRTGTFTVYARFTPIPVRSVTLNKTSETIYTNNSNGIQLSATVIPYNAADTSVKWSSSKPGVATVSSKGKVMPVSAGTAVITCTSKSNPSAKDTFTVTVKQYVNSVSLSAGTDEIFEGKTLQLSASVSPSNASNKSLAWSSSNSSVATVDQNGKVTGVKSGTAVITAKAKDRNQISGTFKIHILLPVTAISLDRTSAVLYTNNTAGLQLNPSLTPAAASLQSVGWESSAPGVATVSREGLVRPVAPGTATITCRSKSHSSVTATCTVTVKQYVTSVSVGSTLASIVSGDTLQLSSSVGPANATDKSLNWTSSNTSVATVNSSGVVTGTGAGTAVITATAHDGSGVKDSVRIAVVALPAQAPAVAVSAVTVPGTSLTVYTVNKTAQVAASVLPENADQSMVWASSNENAATIDNTGKITMVRGGSSILTGRAVSDPHKYVNINLRVIQSVERIAITGQNQIDQVGGSAVLTATAYPDNAENKAVSWSWTTINGGRVSVDANGRVTAVANGLVTITATAKDGSGVSQSFRLKVGTDPIPVESITLDETEVCKYMNEKDGVQLFATVLPAYADDLSVIWSSSDEQVAVVDDNGVITFYSPGVTTITCRSVNNPSVTATCAVTVKQYVEQIILSSDKGSLLSGETAQLTAAVYPTNASDKSLTFSSSDTAIASVDQNGKVTAAGTGAVTITALAHDGSGASGTYALVVEKELQLSASVVNDTVYTQGSTLCDLAYISLTPASVRRMATAGYTPSFTITKKSGNGDTAMTVFDTGLTLDGRLYNTKAAVLRGSAFPSAGTEVYTVTCTAGDHEDSIDIAITVDGSAYASGIKLSDASVGANTFRIGTGEAALIPALPFSTDQNAVPEGMTCTVSGDRFYEENAMEVKGADGLLVSFEESGMYAATVRYTKGNLAYEAAAAFNVADADGIVRLRVEDVSLSHSYLSLVEGGRQTLTATVSPADAYNRAVTWTSSDPSVATVTSGGVVRAISPGTAVITCAASDGSGEAAICSVSVESYLQLDTSRLDFTVYSGGSQHADLGIVNVTIDSQKRLAADGLNVSWDLSRISGNSTELGLSEYTASGEAGLSVSGNMFKLLRINGAGTDEYRLTCTAGDHTASCTVFVTVREGVLPNTVTLKKSSYSVPVDTYLAIDTRYTLAPSSSALPEETVIGIDGGDAFWDAVSPLYSYAEPERLIFGKAGTYTAYVTFRGDNYDYRCPITIAVADEDGTVPPAITSVAIVGGDEPMLLTPGDTRTLTLAVEPDSASYGAVTWSSTNTAVATVSQAGKVTAIGAGYAVIVASIPESDHEATCLVYVEEGLNFRTGDLERTVFVDGDTRMPLDTVMLTDNSSSRLEEAPQWTLRRVSGTSLTLRAVPTESVNTQGMTLYGCSLLLYSVSKEGDTVYELTCASGEETKSVTITVHAVYRERLLPASLSMAQTVFTADIGELIVVRPAITPYPSGSRLPDGILVSCEGSTAYQEALNAQDTYVSQSLSTFSFNRAGTYEASFVYSYSNMKYVIPVTFRIRDENGDVPVQASRLDLNHRSLYLTVGDTVALEAVFTPAGATNQAVTWSSSDPSVASVSGSGTVTSLKKGTAYITCEPADTACEAVTCAVTVEDYLAVEAGATAMTLYVQGTPVNNIANAALTEGTIERLERAGITPVWTVDTGRVSHALLGIDAPDGDFRALVNTKSLTGGGTDTYTISCQAGSYTWSQTYTLHVVDLGGTAPEAVTIPRTEVAATVGTPVTIDFTPVVTPAGASMPDGMMDTGIIGIGSFYDALDMTAYAESGDHVTVAFTRPGQYLLTRRYLLSNLQYVTACTVTVGSASDGRGVLSATETAVTVYSGAQSGSVSTVSITDEILYQLWEKDITWQASRISGDSLNVSLKENGSSAEVFVSSVEKNGTDVWRISCSFGGMTESVDITLTAADPRGPLPESISLETDKFSGMIGNWINIPLGVLCSPAGSLLPDQGDAFWSFSFDQAGEERSSHTIENGMLRVRFTVSGYYTGTLSYRSGNVAYSLSISFVIQDEEEEVQKPSLSLFAVNTFDTVYPEGDTGIAIGQMVMAESLSAYSTGAAVAYMKEADAAWKVTRSGTAATLSLRKVSDNVYDLILSQISGSGDVTYTVTCTADGVKYTLKKTLHVAGASEARPDATLPQTAYQAAVGEEVTVDGRMLSRADGSILQSRTDLDSTALLSAVGYEIEKDDDAWKMVFYQAGTYQAMVSAYVSNLRTQIPIVIVVGEKGSQTALSVLKLPSALTVIEEEAFEGSRANVIDLRGTRVTTIGAGAFRYCVDARIVYLPSSVTFIAEDAFYGCLNAQFCCETGSYAAGWAADHNFTVVEP